MKTYYRANDQVVMAEITLEDYNAMTKQIAELQEMNKSSLEVINNLNEVVKVKSRDILTARKETAEAKDKLHRRNLQIADLKKEVLRLNGVIVKIGLKG